MVKRFDIISLFPDYFKGPFSTSILKRAQERNLIAIRHIDLRSFGKGRYRQVDDRPYGGGPGMVLMAEPILEAIHSVKEEGSRVIYLSPQGTPLVANKCEELAREESHLVLLCGHYEGVDQRALDLAVDEEISIGDYVLTSGAPAAIVLIDSVARFVSGVIGNGEATAQDSFAEGIFEAPLYTRPSKIEEREVPSVLRFGHHGEIEKWRKEQAMKKTKRVRPDLEFVTHLAQKQETKQ